MIDQWPCRARPVRRADAGGLRPGADPERPDHWPELHRRVPGRQLPLPEALYPSAAGLPGHVVRLGYPDGVRRRAGRGADAGLAAVCRQHPVVHRVRHLVRHGRPRGRSISSEGVKMHV